MKPYKVQAGDCLASIAAEHHTSWRALWDANPKLRALRKDPGILYPGDIIFVPNAQPTWFPSATGQRHTFVTHRRTSPVRVRFLKGDDSPRGKTEIRLVIDGDEQKRNTDEEGYVTFDIPALAKRGKLYIGADPMSYPVTFGDLDPHDTETGAQARLRHLAYYMHRVDGDIGAWTRRALRAFQLDANIEPTAELDGPTFDALFKRFGS